MTDDRVTAPLARAGLDVRRATTALDAAGLSADEVDDLVAVSARAADPSQAFDMLCRLGEDAPAQLADLRDDTAWLERVATVAGASRPLGDLLLAHPDAMSSLRHDRPVDADEIAALVVAGLDALLARHPDADVDDLARAVAGVRRITTAAIAGRDLTGAIGVEETAAELSALAAGVLDGTLTVLHRRLAGDAPAARVAIIGMGKLGGNELNYVSDVDVLFVHEPTGEDADAAAREAVETCTALLAVLNASTTMGRAYEIDPTLRPEGRSGALSRTVDAFTAYWERWAATWEFQAMLKARVVAGDRELGAAFLAAAEPFVWPDEMDPGVVGEIRAMKGRVETKPEVVRHGERQVKLGPGGLRDIEFAVQLLQVVHGRVDERLRTTNTLDALRQLADGGYVSDDDAQLFAQAYRTLRVVEHRLQLVAERRTHTIPTQDEKVERLARSLGYQATAETSARAAFRRHLADVQRDVRTIHQKLFYRPLLEAHAAVAAHDAAVVDRAGLDDAAAQERLLALGFADARGVLRDVRSMTRGLSRRSSTLRAVLPVFLAEVRDTPDPDRGVARLRDLVERMGRHQDVIADLRDHPPTVAALATLIGTSPVAATLLEAVPSVVPRLAQADWQLPSRDERIAMAQARLPHREAMSALRRLKREWLVEVVVADLLHDLPQDEVARQLSNIADACLDAGVIAAFQEVAIARGVSRGEDLPLRFAVIGVGRLGGQELHYPSDLDVLFVHEPLAGADRSEMHAVANEVAERIIRLLGEVTAEGTAFEVDADLRPEGRVGPLSRSLESHAAYLARWSETWEHQALLKARPVAGDVGLGQRYHDLVQPLALPDDMDDDRVRAVRMMKARVEKDRGGGRDDLKLGPGGLSDIEWTVQLLQLQHAHDVPGLRAASTPAAIRAAGEASLLSDTEVEWLLDGLDLLSRLRNRLHLLGIRPVDRLPPSRPDRNRVGHAMGMGPRSSQQLEDEFRRTQRHVRKITDTHFFGIT